MNEQINFDLLGKALEEADAIILVIQNNTVKYTNRKLALLTGYSVSEIIDKKIFEFIELEDREKITELQLKIMKGEGIPCNFIFHLRNKLGKLILVHPFSADITWKEAPAELVLLQDVTHRRITEIILTESEKLLHSIIRNLSDPTFVIDVNGKVIIWNRAIEKLTNIKAEETIGREYSEFVVAFFGYRQPILIDLLFKHDSELEKEYDFFERNDDILIGGRFCEMGEKKLYIWATSSILFDLDGNIIGAVGSFRDLTSLKTTEKKLKESIREKESLLKEIHHRVKNNMQVISSLLNLQQSHIKDPKARDVFKVFVNRIRSMSLIHENLYRDGVFADIDFSEYIPLLVNKLSVAYNNPAVSTEFEMEKIRLNMDSAIPCGLILNELVSNCYKYAFPGGRMGRISIKLFAEKESGRCALIVHDNGAGFPDSIDFNNPDSLGILMINMLVYQLNGEIRLTKENGTEFKISFPL